MAELANLKSKRTSLKGKLTRLKNYVDSINKDEVDESIVEELQLRLVRIEPLLEEFNDLQFQIERVCSTESSSYTEDQVERTTFENTFFKLTSDISAICKKFKEKSEISSVGSHNSAVNQNVNITQPLVKLPPIKLPTFNGHYDSWLEFKDAFLALVDNNDALTDIQKFYYLKSSLEKEALEIIKSIQVSSLNYKVAWQFLSDRFENKNLIIHNHIKAIFEHPNIIKESHVDLRNLYDSVTKHLRSLRALGEDTKSWDRLVLFIMTNKFDTVTRRDWETYKYQGELPSMEDLNIFLKQKCEVLQKLEVTNNECANQVQKSVNKGSRRQSNSLAATSANNDDKVKCYYCNLPHSIYKCQSFLKLNIEDRIASIKRLTLCLNCLRDSHLSWKCKKPKCFKCGKAHNTLLHLESYSKNIQSTDGGSSNAPSEVDESPSVNSSTLSSFIDVPCRSECAVAGTSKFSVHSQVLLSTAIIKVINGDKEVMARALLDSGSQSNFISQELCDKLNLKKSKIEHTVKGVGQILTHINNQTNVLIKSRVSGFAVKINCLILQKITDKLPVMSFDKNSINISPNLQLADPDFNIQKDIHILLGSNVFWSVIEAGQVRLGPNLPVMQETKLGYVIAGNLSLKLPPKQPSISCLNIIDNSNSIDNKISKFWEIEEIKSKTPCMTVAEQYCENYFEKTTRQDEYGRFIVKIPFKRNIDELGNSREIALNRFNILEKKFEKNPNLKKEYIEFMTEYYCSLGHMSEIEDIITDSGYYLPHHAVVKNDSVTTRCRVVFNASAKTSSGLSLNDVQFVGPTLQQDVFSILTRFRIHKYVLTGDVSKMYRQVLVDKDERKYQKIFWRDQKGDVKVYQLNTVTYGTASAPYLAVKCLFQIAANNKNMFPRASKIIERDFYMDDLLTGADSVSELLSIQKKVVRLLNEYGFELRKFLCNDKDLLQQFEVNKNLDVSILNIGENSQTKTLGVYWDSNNDFLKYKVVKEDNFPLCKITKRLILSHICQIFDPLGLIGPKISCAKLLMQELWKLKLDWDEEIPTDLLGIWKAFYKDLSYTNQLNIPRCAVFSQYVSIELHGFCDASIKAYGACVYIRCLISSGKYTSSLLCAKSRVAPLKQVSLPRLELCGALLLANLVKRTIDSLEITFNNLYYWCDSTITLFWIRNESGKWKTFVANRVSEIRFLTDSQNWNHVKSKENPADLLSRGESIKVLSTLDLWWRGPEWFHIDSSNWDWSMPNPDSTNIPEQQSLSCVVIKSNNQLDSLLKRFSSFYKTLRVLAYVLRFISNIKLNSHKRVYGALLPEELDDSLNIFIKNVQIECFPIEYNNLKNQLELPRSSKILSLNPFLENGILRVGGRIRKANQPFDKKHPIILPSHHVLTSQILKNEHERLLHCGVQTLLYSIREKYWPISGRNACKNIVRKCIICFRAAPKDMNYLMGDLPSVRVNPYSVFSNVGTDFGGPFFLKDRLTRSPKIIKTYICLFVCMSTKAIHIELVSGLTTEAFLAAFKRFSSRRGKPSNVYSDNGLNYVGANNELIKIYEFLKGNSENIANQLVNEKIRWHFIPARSPSFGGIWEAGIKCAKHHIKRVIGEKRLTFEEFSTVLTQIECILNSRPITPLSQDPDDLSALTPGHFLIGKPLNSLPDIEVPENRLSKWQQIQAMSQHFWTRWQKEYLSEMQQRTKWKQNYQQLLKVGTLVLVKNDNAPSLNWQLGRISALHPGMDGIVRVLDIKVFNGTLTRAVNRVCALPVE